MDAKSISSCVVYIQISQRAEHPWLREGGAPDRPIDSAVLSRMKQFKAMNKLKQLALKVNPYY